VISLRIEGSGDVLDLDGIAKTGYGFQALSGMTGFGLPPLSLQYQAGAGDGATFRGQRVQPRDVDIPLDIRGRDRNELKALISRLSRVLAGDCTLIAREPSGAEWMLKVRRAGGGDIVYGKDTIGESDAQMVVTFRAGDPFFTSVGVNTKVVNSGVSGVNAFVSNLLTLPVASSQTFGILSLENEGDAPAYPVWTIEGPGTNLSLLSWDAKEIRWEGTLTAGQVLTIDTRTASVTRENGSNQYGYLYTAPRFWAIPPGVLSAAVAMEGTTTASRITCTWRTRKWMVV
jgi:hypothetical protein